MFTDFRNLNQTHTSFARNKMATPCEHTLVKKSIAKSTIWDNFMLKKRKNDGLIEENVAVCIHCNSTIKIAGVGTSNMTAHMNCQ